MPLETVERLALESDAELLWELFHENSKTTFVERHPVFRLWPTDDQIAQQMLLYHRVKPYADRRKHALPDELPAATRKFDDVLCGRETARAFGGGPLAAAQLSKVLHFAYGVNRRNEGTPFPRPFRTIPSGGALYPLEIYLHATRVDDLAPGLYHFDPEDHELDELRSGNEADRISRLLIQPELAAQAAAIVFISAVFARSTFKYGDRGYRFALLEAGHLGQNANLTAQEMGLATANIGGYDDRGVDRYLGLDGLNESVVYVLLLGQPAD